MDDNLIEILSLIFDMPPEKAVDYMESQGYKITHNWQEQADAIRQHCFTVAKTSSADALQVIHDGLKTSLNDGKGFDFFKRSVKGLLEQKGFGLRDDGTARRYDVIFRTNLQSAYQAGRFYEMEAAGEDFPYREYVAIDDTRTTSGCRQLDGRVFHYKDKFYLQNQTPRHFNCRSTWVAVSKDERVDLKTGKDFENIKTEQGFGVEPGTKPWKPDMKKYAGDVVSPVIDDLITFKTKSDAINSIREEFVNDQDFIDQLEKLGVKSSITESGSPGSRSIYFTVQTYNKSGGYYDTAYKVRISDHKTTANWEWRSKDAEIFIEDRFLEKDQKRLTEIDNEDVALKKSLHGLPKGMGEFVKTVQTKRESLAKEKFDLQKKAFYEYRKKDIDKIKSTIIDKVSNVE
jgi:SPP1 gp7 family putative phage head morphogenesis protein